MDEDRAPLNEHDYTNLRLEALKLALQLDYLEHEYLLAAADAYYKFLIGNYQPKEQSHD